MPENNASGEAVAPVYTNKDGVVRLTKSGLLKDKEAGLTNPEMAKKYNLTIASITKALKMAGVVKRAKQKATFEIVPDEA